MKLKTDFKPGDAVVFHRWIAGRPGTDQMQAVVKKVGKHRITIELGDGKKKYVHAENLRRIKPSE